MASLAPQTTKVLRTRRLTLRAACESDLAAFHEIFSNEDIMRYWSVQSIYHGRHV